MTFFAIVLLDKLGNILAVEPKGCQFQNHFLENIAAEESENQTPHPASFDMGGFSLVTLWSGIQPFIVMPSHFVGVVCDESEDINNIKKTLRKLTNNILLTLKDNKGNLDQYLTEIWSLLQAGKMEDISILKPQDLIEKSVDKAEDVGEFEELLDISADIGGGLPESDDPFSSSSNSPSLIRTPKTSLRNIDPFGGSSSGPSDPFAGSSSGPSDPFGGNQIKTYNQAQKSEPNNKNTNSLDYNPNLFGTAGNIKLMDKSSDEIFLENPWDNETIEPSADPTDDPFSSDPFSSDPFSSDSNSQNTKEKRKDDK